MIPPINYCSACGAAIAVRVPAGDSRPRHVCDACGTVHYRNPLVVAGTLPIWQDQVLLCRRAIEPRSGLWTLPAGFMEVRETVAQAAMRETDEETGAKVELEDLYCIVSVPHISQVHVIFRARLLALEFAPGEETAEVALFREAEVPWDQIAFRSITLALRHFFADREAGRFILHNDDIPAP
jgi:ADP-ribose pyrophosphatase YjhB (NUDIX family)